MKRMGMLLLTLALLLSLAACGGKNVQPAGAEDMQGTEQTINTVPEEKRSADPRKAEDKTTAPDAAADGGKQAESEVGDAGQEQQKADAAQKTEGKQEEPTPADAGTAAPESKPETPAYGNGSLTASQVREMQRWYGVSADGQWGAGSAKAAGGRTADDAWAYYQKNRKSTSSELPASGTGTQTDGSGSGDDWITVEYGGVTFSGKKDKVDANIAAYKAKREKAANIDWAAVADAGNTYAESLGLMVCADGAEILGYAPPSDFEADSYLFKYELTQENAVNIMKSMVNSVKKSAEANMKREEENIAPYLALYGEDCRGKSLEQWVAAGYDAATYPGYFPARARTLSDFPIWCTVEVQPNGNHWLYTYR